MEEKQASIKVSIAEGLAEISGSESFINSQIENFKELIKLISDTKPKASTKKYQEKESEKVSSNGTENDDDPLNSLEDIFTVDSDKVKIVCDIPGNTNSKKVLHIALLYSYALKLKGKEESIVEEIREICSEHGCLDQTNFSTQIKNGNPQLYIDKGTGSERTIKLTKPGETKVLDLIKKIRESVNTNS